MSVSVGNTCITKFYNDPLFGGMRHSLMSRFLHVIHISSFVSFVVSAGSLTGDTDSYHANRLTFSSECARTSPWSSIVSDTVIFHQSESSRILSAQQAWTRQVIRIALFWKCVRWVSSILHLNHRKNMPEIFTLLIESVLQWIVFLLHELKRGTAGCSKFKVQKTWQIQGRWGLVS